MSANNQFLAAIPTNVITGFLGVGKTTAILSLLAKKPKHETWAVLVNEFGEIGIDGELLKGSLGNDNTVFVRQVPGGCMCCAAGLPMQVALNQLLKQAKPDRLLIEPTGLGHPKEVLQVLHSEQYQYVLDIQQTVTLVDARKLADPRYIEHDTFNQQIEIADLVVGNKVDLYLANQKQQLIDFVAHSKNSHAQVLFTEQGKLDPMLLKSSANNLDSFTNELAHHNHHHNNAEATAQLPESGFIKVENSGEGFQSIGWRFSKRYVFDRKKLNNFLLGFTEERIKAVMLTDEGVFAFNFSDGCLTESVLLECEQSCIEIIARTLPDNLHEQLMALHRG